MTGTDPRLAKEREAEALAAPVRSSALAHFPGKTQELLLRMFTDPYLLNKDDRTSLVAQLRDGVARNQNNPDVRVLLGMALCVDLQPQAALEQLREAVRLAPRSFIAHLKLGELWMRLRVCDKAEEHTRRAGTLARNLPQAELARRQAATLRSMQREGIERGGYRWPGLGVAHLLRRLRTRKQQVEELSVLNAG